MQRRDCASEAPEPHVQAAGSRQQAAGSIAAEPAQSCVAREPTGLASSHPLRRAIGPRICSVRAQLRTISMVPSAL